LDQAGNRIAGAQIEAADLARADVDVVGPGEIRAVGRTQEAEAVLQDLEHAVAVDILAAAGVRLEDGEDDVLLARASQILQPHLLRNLHQLRHRLELELRQVHRLTRSRQLRRRNDAAVFRVERIILRQLVARVLSVAAVAGIAVAAPGSAAFARSVTGLITEIASHSLPSRKATRSDLRSAPTFMPSTWPFLKRMSVGIPRTLKRCGALGLSSMLSLAMVSLPRY